MRYLASVVEQVHLLPLAPYLLSVDRLRGDRFLHSQPYKALYRCRGVALHNDNRT